MSGGLVAIDGRHWYEIQNYDTLTPFFISLVSSSDHWWFISSTGGMTAGRRNADHALLPYETEDKIALGVGHTGPLTLLRVKDDAGHARLWEPLSQRTPHPYDVERRIRKTVEGDALCFEERNLDLELTFRMTLRTGPRVGFIRTIEVLEHGGRARQVDILDGYRNLLPHGATQALQSQMSVLLDAYKRNELEGTTGVAFFSLSSTLTDRAEASEALRANVVWSVGLTPRCVLLTPDERIDAFRRGEELSGDEDIRGHRGAFLLHASAELCAKAQLEWHTVADVSLDARAAGQIRVWKRDLEPLEQIALLERDIAEGTRALIGVVGRTDGLSIGGDRLAHAHHFANALFNAMRGGVFVDGHNIETRDFRAFVAVRNRVVASRQETWLQELPDSISQPALVERAEATASVDLVRLVLEYLPLTFSRRHGDPSRPWNRFEIQLRNPDGTNRTDYQGNWRDIFQNWEPLAYSCPAFAFSMVAKFLNATTVDGYNPYRVTRDGVDWETPEPDSPWANLGYWGDHQIIYLQKLLEAVERFAPGRLERTWSRQIFTYADVPYRLASYDEMLRDWSRTVSFDQEAHARTVTRSQRIGTDGRLLPSMTDDGTVHHVTMAEKLLVLLLAKLTNFVPGAGIWMNTQRPEWNDANNALVGKGVSVVTAAYLRRFAAFQRARLSGMDDALEVPVAGPVASLMRQLTELLDRHRPSPGEPVRDETRREVMDALGGAATEFRSEVYARSSSTVASVAVREVDALLELTVAHLDHALLSNQRADGLFHSYLVLGLGEGTASTEPLTLMLEGQVAVLSSGILGPAEAAATLRALRESELFWPEQHTYRLYPNRRLAGFLEKNAFPTERLLDSALAPAMLARGDHRLVTVDPHDELAHFGGDLRNADDLAALLDTLEGESAYAAHLPAERERFLELFEEVFDHRSFTGRSGTFFAYEGLGSVYWHMVSKLLLAAQECFHGAIDGGAPPELCDELAAAYDDIRAGLGSQKSPAQFGAFPTDPYSHTPETGTARQPGMTGQVKEELLTRMGELGVRVLKGELHFEPRLLRRTEAAEASIEFNYLAVDGELRSIEIPVGGIGFTFAQTPVIYTSAGDASPKIRVHMSDGSERLVEGGALGAELSRQVFDRDGTIERIEVVTGPWRD